MQENELSTLGYWLKQERESSESQQAFVQVAARELAQAPRSGALRVHIRDSLSLEIDLPVDEKQLDPLSGGVFVFCNRQRHILKALYWDANGFCEWLVKTGRSPPGFDADRLG